MQLHCNNHRGLTPPLSLQKSIEQKIKVYLDALMEYYILQMNHTNFRRKTYK